MARVLKKVFMIALAMVTLMCMSLPAFALHKCAASGCNDVVTGGGIYCYTHTCRENGCNNKAVNRYCSTHKCKQPGCDRRYWYTSGRYKGYCEYCAVENASPKAKQELYNANKKYIPQKKTVTSNSQKTTSNSKKTASKSTKRYTMPDCDDYEDYDDFMDDWDGCMPDGSDAEDYWENW